MIFQGLSDGYVYNPISVYGHHNPMIITNSGDATRKTSYPQKTMGNF